MKKIVKKLQHLLRDGIAQELNNKTNESVVYVIQLLQAWFLVREISQSYPYCKIQGSAHPPKIRKNDLAKNTFSTEDKHSSCCKDHVEYDGLHGSSFLIFLSMLKILLTAEMFQFLFVMSCDIVGSFYVLNMDSMLDRIGRMRIQITYKGNMVAHHRYGFRYVHVTFIDGATYQFISCCSYLLTPTPSIPVVQARDGPMSSRINNRILKLEVLSCLSPSNLWMGIE